MHIIRRGGSFDIDEACARGGPIASKSGNVIVTPAPRNSVRRENRLQLVMCIHFF